MRLPHWIRHIFGLEKANEKAVTDGLLEKEFGARPAASQTMDRHTGLWYALYTNHPPWESECVRPLGLPGAIGREIARHVLTEFSVSFPGGERNAYLNAQLQAASKDFSGELERGLCLGGCALKPYPDGGRLLVDGCATAFTPTRFDGSGRCLGGVFKSEPVRQGKEWFVRLEFHNLDAFNDRPSVYTVENKAYKSDENGGIGAPVGLEAVRAWADLEPLVRIEGLERPLFAYFKPPQANDIELGSQLGVSVYGGATVDLIRQTDEQWYQLLREYKTGKRRMLFNGSVMKASQVDDEFYEYGDFTSDTTFFQFINPELRDDPLYNGFQRILQRIEFNVGLAYGTLSDPQTVEKTATEILAAKNRQFVMEKAIKEAFQQTLDDLLYAMNALCDLNQLAPSGDYQAEFSWGDGVLDDPDTRRQDMSMDLQLVREHLMSRVAFVMKWDKVDEAEAKRRLAVIDADAGDGGGQMEEEE